MYCVNFTLNLPTLTSFTTSVMNLDLKVVTVDCYYDWRVFLTFEQVVTESYYYNTLYEPKEVCFYQIEPQKHKWAQGTHRSKHSLKTVVNNVSKHFKDFAHKCDFKNWKCTSVNWFGPRNNTNNKSLLGYTYTTTKTVKTKKIWE